MRPRPGDVFLSRGGSVDPRRMHWIGARDQPIPHRPAVGRLRGVVKGRSRTGSERQQYPEGRYVSARGNNILKPEPRAAVDPHVEARIPRNSALIVAGRDLSLCRPLGEALARAGVAVQRLVTRTDHAEEIITRADADGSVPIVVLWNANGNGVAFVEELLACDTLPGRPYLLVAPNDIVASLAAESIERTLPDAMDRVLTVNIDDLETNATHELLQLHLSRMCASHIDLPGAGPRATPAHVTDMPVGERVINNIDRRSMQRGIFTVEALRVPRF